MKIYGTINHKNSDRFFTYYLWINDLDNNAYIEFNNDNLDCESNSTIYGDYCFYFNNRKGIKRYFNNESELNPIEIMLLIDNNENFELSIDEITPDLKDTDLFVSVVDCLLEEFDIDDSDYNEIYDKLYSDYYKTAKKWLEEFVYYIDSCNFYDFWISYLLNFSCISTDDDLLSDYCRSFIKEVILPNYEN